jgi:hypothetical protein
MVADQAANAMKWAHHRNLRRRPHLPNKGRGCGRDDLVPDDKGATRGCRGRGGARGHFHRRRCPSGASAGSASECRTFRPAPTGAAAMTAHRGILGSGPRPRLVGGRDFVPPPPIVARSRRDDWSPDDPAVVPGLLTKKGPRMRGGRGP